MGRIEKLPHYYKMHSSMCLELKNLVDRVMKIFPDIEDSRPGSSTGIQTLCLINKSLEKAKLLLQYCSESSKLYMAVTGDAILLRSYKAKKLLEQSLSDIRSMVPIVLATKITQVVQDLRSTVLALESSEEEAGKAVRELMQQSRTSSVSSDEVKDFHYAALKLHLSTPEAIVIERRSLKSLLSKLGECEVNKRQILKYLLCLLKKHEKIIWRDHKENSFTQLHSVNDSVCASAAEAGCSEEHNATLPEHFKCHISRTVMYDPVIISSGHTYERMWIQKWFDEGNESCPKSRKTLDDLAMKPNFSLKDKITRWCSKHGLDVQDPTTKHTTKTLQNLDFSIASFGSSLYNLDFLSRDFSTSFSTDSPSYSKISKGGYFMPMQTIASESGTEVTDSSYTEVEIEPLCELTKLPWDDQVKTIQDVRKRFDHNSRAFQSMSPSKFLDPLITFLKNGGGTNGDTTITKIGLDLLLSFLSGNTRAIEALEQDVFETLSVFLGFELVSEEALNVLEALSNQPHSLSKITSSGRLLSSLLKMAESGAEHLQEKAMTTLKNLSSSNEICHEMVSLGFVKDLTSFLQESVFSKQSIIMLRNVCNTEKGRVCITEAPSCLASVAELLDSNVSEEQENAISILLQLCVEKIEYCNLVVREGVGIYPSLFLISNNGTEEAKVGASELLRALEEVDLIREEEEPSTATTTSQVVTPVITTPTPKKYGLFGLSFSILKKKKRYRKA